MTDRRTLFDSLSGDAISQLVAERAEETLHLEFKTISDPSLDREDRKNFACALSAFSNSDGGIIIWGVSARRDSDGVDRADKLVPITDLSRFLARLNTLTHDAASPVVDGVTHRGFSTSPPEGVAATYVPDSPSGPHMAKFGDDRYYKRSGSSSVKMEHFDLEDMFGRRRRPALALTYRIVGAGGRTSAGVTVNRFLVVLALENRGRGPARAPYLDLRVEGPHHLNQFGLDDNGALGLPKLAHARKLDWTAFGASDSVVIHPDVALEVTAIPVEVTVGGDYPPDLQLRYRIAADGMRMVEECLSIEIQEIADVQHK